MPTVSRRAKINIYMSVDEENGREEGETSFAQRNRPFNNASIFFRPENRRRNDVKAHSPLRYAINGESVQFR